MKRQTSKQRWQTRLHWRRALLVVLGVLMVLLLLTWPFLGASSSANAIGGAQHSLTPRPN